MNFGLGTVNNNTNLSNQFATPSPQGVNYMSAQGMGNMITQFIAPGIPAPGGLFASENTPNSGWPQSDTMPSLVSPLSGLEGFGIAPFSSLAETNPYFNAGYTGSLGTFYNNASAPFGDVAGNNQGNSYYPFSGSNATGSGLGNAMVNFGSSGDGLSGNSCAAQGTCSSPSSGTSPSFMPYQPPQNSCAAQGTCATPQPPPPQLNSCAAQGTCASPQPQPGPTVNDVSRNAQGEVTSWDIQGNGQNTSGNASYNQQGEITSYSGQIDGTKIAGNATYDCNGQEDSFSETCGNTTISGQEQANGTWSYNETTGNSASCPPPPPSNNCAAKNGCAIRQPDPQPVSNGCPSPRPDPRPPIGNRPIPIDGGGGGWEPPIARRPPIGAEPMQLESQLGLQSLGAAEGLNSLTDGIQADML